MLELYHSGLTTCSKQVRLALAEKEIPYVSRYIELHAHEHLSRDYLALNPWGVVPTLVHDDAVIVNSAAINEYIEDVFPEPPLSPADSRARARMRLWMWAADNVHPAMQNATYDDMLKASLSQLSVDDIERVIERMPAPERRERLRKVTGGGIDRHDIELAFERLLFVLDRAEADLAHGPWFAGADYSLADIAMLAIVHRAFELAPERLGGSRFPRVNDWHDRMKARPTVAHVYAPGTDEAPKRPARQSVAGMR